MFFHWFSLQFRVQDFLFCITRSLEYCSQILTDQYHPQKCGTEEGSFWDKCPSFVIPQQPVTPLSQKLLYHLGIACLIDFMRAEIEFVLFNVISSVLSAVGVQVIVKYEF